ncbi:MAG TPA: hypothetical protein VKB50_11690 [Vicinamibacterales bacterium]|nr:hypothetical protein [Vicinamibacterales bacterium]
MKVTVPSGVAGRSILLAIFVVAVLFTATHVPLVQVTTDDGSKARWVPLDAWAVTQFPATRDVYRDDVEVLFQLKRLPLLALFAALVTAAVLSFPKNLGVWLAERMPPLSARALGAYRMALGLGLFAALRTEVPVAVPLDHQRLSSWLARLDLVRTLSASPGATTWIWHAASILLLCFAIGLLPRLTLAAAAAAMTLFVGAGLTAKGMHDWGIPLITVWMLVLVPWQDSIGVHSVIARWRRRVPPPVPPSLRGLAVWLPGLTLGLAFLAAAFAKLDTSGVAWITSGAVRFHFIEDARQAPVSWGLLVAQSDVAAVALSLGAIMIEGAFWTVAFFKHPAVRALYGVAGLGMLTGFYFFQGVYWPAWWALFLAFLPWSLIDRGTIRVPATAAERASSPPAHHEPAEAPIDTPVLLPRLASAVIVMLTLQQLIVSALRAESEPFFSDYSMYSYTWPSKKAFDAHLREKTARYELSFGGLTGDELDRRVRELGGVDVLRDAIGRATRGEPWPDSTRAALAVTRREYHQRFGESLSKVTVRILHRGFDWTRGTFYDPPRLIGQYVLDLDAGRFEPDAR